MPEEEVNASQFITSPSQLGAPPEPRRVIVELPGWPLKSGKKFAKFYVHELTALEAVQYQRSLRVYENGRHVGSDAENSDLKLLSFVVRDPNGNRPWPTPEAAVNFFGNYALRVLNPLLEAYFKLSNAEETEEVLEGNSEETPTSS